MFGTPTEIVLVTAVVTPGQKVTVAVMFTAPFPTFVTVAGLPCVTVAILVFDEVQEMVPAVAPFNVYESEEQRAEFPEILRAGLALVRLETLVVFVANAPVLFGSSQLLSRVVFVLPRSMICQNYHNNQVH